MLPGAALDASDACSNEPVITSESLKSKESFFKWFRTLGLKKTYKHQPGDPSPSIYQEYSSFFQRIVGSIQLVEYSHSAWYKVMGPNVNSSICSIGHTTSQPVSPTQDIIRTKDRKTGQDIVVKKKHDSSSKQSGASAKIVTTDRLRHWDMETRPLDAEMTIYLTGQQSSVLLNKSKLCLKALLLGDFGSGK